MKKLLTVIFSVSLAFSIVAMENTSASAMSMKAATQIGYVKRKSKKVYYRTKHGTRYVAHKTKVKTKKGFHKSKRVTKHTYSKTKDKVTN